MPTLDDLRWHAKPNTNVSVVSGFTRNLLGKTQWPPSRPRSLRHNRNQICRSCNKAISLPVSANFCILLINASEAFSMSGTICFSLAAVKVGVSVVRIRFHGSSRAMKSPESNGGLGFTNGGRFGNFENSFTIICLTISGSQITIDGVLPIQIL